MDKVLPESPAAHVWWMPGKEVASMAAVARKTASSSSSFAAAFAASAALSPST